MRTRVGASESDSKNGTQDRALQIGSENGSQNRAQKTGPKIGP